MSDNEGNLLDIDQIKAKYRLTELDTLSQSDLRKLFKEALDDLIDSKTQYEEY